MSLVGNTLGQYQIIEQIGAGGMATVYKGYQASLDRYVAIKVLAGHLANDDAFRQRFDREAKGVAAISHPHILPVHDFGEQDGMTYIVTELVEGGSLRERLGQPLDPGIAARIVCEIAQALDHAHRQGIIHRDVKPGNILISKDGRTRLSDFGIAKMVAGTQYTRTGTSVGTPAYMSPEQGKGEEIDGRSDIYSLGIVLYEMLTGRTPFRADTPLALLHQQVFSAPPPPRELNPRIPKRLERVILKALAKEPDDRFGTGREMARALEKTVRLSPAEELPAALPEEALTVAVTSAKSDTARRLVRATGRGAARIGKGTTKALWGITKMLLRALLVLLIVALIASMVAVVAGAFALSSFAERTIPSYKWELDQFTAYGTVHHISEMEINEQVGPAIEPYALDVVQDVTVDFAPPESVKVSTKLWDRSLHLHGRLTLEDGILRVYVERINQVPLYVIGGIISNGINQGIQVLFENASFRLDRLDIEETEITVQATAAQDGSSTLAMAVPVPTATLRPSPTAPSTAEPMGVLTIVNEINETIALELAEKEWRLVAGATLELELLVDSYPYAFVVEAPGYEDGRGTIQVGTGNTILRITATANPQETAQSVAERDSRAKPSPIAQPTEAPYCPRRGVQITAPGVDVPLKGDVTVEGTADVPGFEYYKLELGAGTSPGEWATLGELRYEPVVNGPLGRWNSSDFDQGDYVLRLVVVDNTGNYETCQVRVKVLR